MLKNHSVSTVSKDRRITEVVPIVLLLFAASVNAITFKIADATLRPLGVGLTALCLIVAIARVIRLWSILNARARLYGFAPTFRPFKTVLSQNDTKNRVYFGLGAQWTPQISQRLYRLLRNDSEALLLPFWFAQCLVSEPLKTKETIGLGYIHGVLCEEKPITVPLNTLKGGTLIVGTTQSGKGILLTLLVTQAIARGETVICFDPKGSNRLKHAIESSAASFRRPYYPIELRHSSGSLYGMNPLKHYARVSEIATRITNLIDDEGPFKNFAWSALYAVAGLTHALGKPMTLVEIKRAFERGLNRTILEAIRVYLEKFQYILTGNCVCALLIEDDRLIEAYENRHQQPENLSQFEKMKLQPLEAAIDRSIRFLKSPPDYTEKIISNLYPILEMLTSDTLQDILSVGTTDEDHSNPFREVDLSELVNANGVLYVATDALSDRTVAAALGDIFLSDITAFAGSLYRNNSIGKGGGKKAVSVFIDECSNMMNDSLIELLNKGAEAGFEVTCAMQTVSDLTARLKSESKARMALGNFNNLIVLRTKDKITADFATEMFGKTSVEELTGTVSTGSTSDDPQSVRAGYSKKIATRRDTLVPEEILSRLPDGEWFAILGGHDLIKGRTPILTFEK